MRRRTGILVIVAVAIVWGLVFASTALASWTKSVSLDPQMTGDRSASLLDPSGQKFYVFGYAPGGGNLRLVTSATSHSSHSVQTLDGAGGTNGRINANVGSMSSAVFDGTALNVFYYDSTHTNLRHAWQPSGGSWHFETLDGAGGPRGRLTGDIGAWPAARVFGGALHVFYSAITGGNERHAWFDAAGWHFQTLDGAGGTGGRVNAQVGFNTRVAAYGSKLHVFYFRQDPFCDPDAGCNIFGWIREARLSGSTWTFSTVAAINCCFGGQSLATASLSSTNTYLFYENFGVHGERLESLHWNGSAWASSGTVEDNAFSDGDIGGLASATVFGGRPHVFYVGTASDTTDGVRDAHWNGSTWVVTPFGIAGAPSSSLVFMSKMHVFISDAHPLDASITDGLEEWTGP